MNLRRAVKNTWCWKFINTKPGKYIKFLYCFFLIWSTWESIGFYAKVQLVQPGLVYGPPDVSVRWTTLAFCIISTICFFIESIQNGDDIFTNKKLPFLSQSLTNFLVIYFEDIPLLVLNLIVTLCRDGDPTVISVIKASVGIAVVVIRLILMLLVYWLFDTKKSRFHFICDILSSIGLLLIAGISIAIQLLNNFPTNSSGIVQAVDPAQFNRMSYITDKYLKNVGIYSRWPLEDQTNSSKYIWLADITEVVQNSYLQIGIRTDYEINNQNYTLCITKLSQTNCYLVQDSKAVKINSVDLSSGVLSTNGYDLAFSKEPAQDYVYLVGYIDYNLNKFVSNNQGEKTCSVSTASSVIYAKFPTITNTKDMTYLRNDTGTEFYFYDYKWNLLTVDKFWKTGVLSCSMSGDLGPKLSRELRLSC